MKKYFFVLCISCAGVVSGQVPNDDCSNATYLGTFLSPVPSNNCFDGVPGYDTALSASNVNAIANYPYFGMSSCQGYTSNNITPANDVWYKLEIFSDFEIKVSWMDTIHINVWHGQDCSSLIPCGCFTFDLTGNPGNYTANFKGNVSGEFTYLQFSGPHSGKTGNFTFCIKKLTSTVDTCYGTKTIITGINEGSFAPDSLIVFSNPSANWIEVGSHYFDIKRIEIFDIQGKIVESVAPNSQKSQINLQNISVGFYFLKVEVNNKLIIRKIVRFGSK